MSDIFVAFPPDTKDNNVIFGKNSDRPKSEVQEIVYYAGSEHAEGSKVHCTYIEINQAERTYDVILSKPTWSWGAEMGANQHGVCVGCTSVWTKLCHSGDHQEKLIGVDFVRLALERAKSAKDSLSVVTSLLEKYGQGGPNSNDPNFGQWSYHNSFLITDSTEAWVLDTAGKFWVAKKYTSGHHNISSSLSLTTEYDLTSPGLTTEAETAGYWKADKGPLNFMEAFGAEFTGISLSEQQLPSSRLKRGQELLQQYSKEGQFSFEEMSDILRDDGKRSSINFSGELLTVSSQISVLPPADSNIPHSHWFTGTPNAAVSLFKPFFFCPDVDVGIATLLTASSHEKKHALYKAHERKRLEMEESIENKIQAMENSSESEKTLLSTLLKLEKQCIDDVTDCLKDFTDDMLIEFRDLFKDVSESEIKFYKP